MVEKNQQKEKAKRQRVWIPINTGTRTHEDDEHLSRPKQKEQDYEDIFQYLDR